MIAYRVSLNGGPPIVAGSPEMGVLTTIITAVGRLGPASAGSRTKPEGLEIDLQVSGATAPGGSAAAENLRWLQRELQIGDEIVIKVVDVADADAPAERPMPEAVVDAEQRAFERARAIYLHLREKYETGQ